MINVSVLGCGHWGPNLIRNFNGIDGCRTKTVCDTDKRRLEYMKGLYPNINTTCDLQTILEDSEITAVAIATPAGMHYSMAKACLEAGKHVLIEKPMATSSAQCQELVDLAEERRLVLAVGHTFIYSSPIKKIKELVKSGALGEILYVSSRRLNLGLYQKDINVAWDLAPHDISVLLHILGHMPTAVNCQGKAHITPGVEDITNMTLFFPTGAVATIQSSWLDPNKTREMTFVGSKRMLVYNDLEPMEKIKIYDKRVETPPYYDTFADFHYSYHYGDIYSPFLQQSEPLRGEAQHFIECVRTGAKPDTCGDTGLKVVRILEAASASLRENGGRIEIENGNGRRPHGPFLVEAAQAGRESRL